MEYEAYFRSVLEVVASSLLHADSVRWGSGDTGPAPSTDRWVSALNRNASTEREREVLSMSGPRSCVIGLPAYSDSSQLSWSGGKLSILSPHRLAVESLALVAASIVLLIG